jgi:hypothetical protein
LATQAGPARSPAPDPAAALHAEVRTAFAEAARRCGVARHDLAVAGVPVRLRIAGPALERALLPALAPLDRVVAAAGPTVLLLDGAAAGLLEGLRG